MLNSKLANNKRFLLLYGSQTGQAQAIAEELKEKCEECGINADLHCLGKFEREFQIEREKLIVFLISTTGDGELPETVCKASRRLRKKTLSINHLKDVRYSLLALGDSNYTSFCNAGKNFDKRLTELGAQKFMPTSYADDAIGLEVIVEPWLDSVIFNLKKELNIDNMADNVTSIQDMKNDILKDSENTSTLNYNTNLQDADLSVAQLPKPFIEISFTSEAPPREYEPLNGIPLPSSKTKIMPCEVVSIKRLTESDKVKEIYELTVELPEALTDYKPGDSFGFLCKNDETEVVEILQHLKMENKMNNSCQLVSILENKKIPKHLPSHATLHHLLSQCCEIRTIPKKALLRALSEHTEDKKEKRRLLELCSRQGAVDYSKFIREGQICLLDIFRKFPTCKPPVEILLEHLPMLQPRFYSVSSSPLSKKNSFTFVFSLISLPETENRLSRFGVCTKFFKDIFSAHQLTKHTEEQDLVEDFSKLTLKKELTLSLYQRNNLNFFLPEDLSIPLIMIGPGTGVGPFLGFLKHREILIKKGDDKLLETVGETWLFFGCRYKDFDYIYQNDLELLKSKHILNHLCLSFSRDNENSRQYVQDQVKENGSKLITLIEEKNAIIYICGDARNMAKDVSTAFINCFKEFKNTSLEEAQEWLKILQEKKQFLQDVWL